MSLFTQIQAAAAEDQASGLRLFNRNASITIARQLTSGFAVQTGNAIEISELRIKFEIKKNLSREPNRCVVTVINASPATRAEAQYQPLYAILRAGYDGVSRLLFSGSVMHAVSTLKAPAWETKLQLSDGGRSYANAALTRSYAKPVSVRQVIGDAAASMGLKVPPEIEQTPELRQALANGLSVHGPTRDTLTKILAPYGYGWSVQNGKLQILRDGQVRQGEAILIDEDAGMIESPELSIPKKIGDPTTLTVKVKLFPELIPAQLIQVKSRSINGQFRIKELEHKGDTRGKEFETLIKAVPLGQPLTKSKRRR